MDSPIGIPIKQNIHNLTLYITLTEYRKLIHLMSVATKTEIPTSRTRRFPSFHFCAMHMKNKEVAMIRATLVLLILSTPAHAYLAQNSLRVQGDAAGFEVQVSPGMGAPNAWCAAGDYAIRYLNLPGTAKIWRMSEPPRGAGEGVSFATSPAGAATKSGLIRLNEQDASLTATAAQALCWGLSD
jgi:hypothetical protein